MGPNPFGNLAGEGKGGKGGKGGSAKGGSAKGSVRHHRKLKSGDSKTSKGESGKGGSKSKGGGDDDLDPTNPDGPDGPEGGPPFIGIRVVNGLSTRVSCETPIATEVLMFPPLF